MKHVTILNDPISDMLTRIRNAIAINKHEIFVPHSKVKESVARLLAEYNFIEAVEVEKLDVGKLMKITINKERENARITEIHRMSKPGRRYYVGADKIPTIKRGRGIVILSTNKGMISGDQARKLGVGGEVVCSVY